MESASSDHHHKPGKRPKLRILLRVAAVLLVLLITTVLLAPMMLSTGAGKSFLERVAGSSLAGSLDIGSLSLGWLGGQRIQNVQFRDSHGSTFKLEEVSTELTLWNALVGNYRLGKTRLRNLEVDISVPDSGSGEAPAKEAKEGVGPTAVKGLQRQFQSLLPRSLVVDAEVTAARIRITAPRKQPVVIDNLEVSLNRAAPGDPLAFRFSGRSRQGDLAGGFTAKGELRGLFGGDGGGEGGREDSAPRGQVEIAVKDLPTDGVDGLLHLGGVLSAGLGPTMNVQVETRATTRSQDLSLRIDCANLHTRLAGRAEDGSFTLTEAGTMTATLAPALLAKLPTLGGGLQLSAPLAAHATLDRLTFPVRGFDPSKVAITARLEARSDPMPGGLQVRALTASLVSDNLASSVALKLEGDLAKGAHATTIRVSGELSDLFDTQGQPQLDKLRLEGSGALDGIPVALADRLLGQAFLAQELLGSRVGLRCTASFAGRERGTLTLDLQAPKVQLGTIAFEVTDKLTLTRPVVLRTTLSNEFLGRFIKGRPPMELRSAVPMELTLSSLAAPRPRQGEPTFQPERTRLEATVTAGPLELTGVQPLGDVTATGMTLSIRGTSLSAMEVQSSLEISQPDPGGALRELTGPKPLKISAQAAIGITHQGITATDVHLGLDSQRVVGRVLARVDEGLTTASLKEPAQLRLVLVPALLDRLGLVKPGSPRLASPATLVVAAEKAHIPFADSLVKLQFISTATLDRVTLAGDGAWSGASLGDVRMSLRFDGAAGSGTAKVEGKASVPGQQEPGSLAVDAKVAGLRQEGDKASLDATVQLDGLPTAFLEALGKQGGMVGVIGPKVGVHATAHLAGLQEPKGVVDARLQSQNLMVDAGLDCSGTIRLLRPVTARLVLTQEGYQQLLGGSQATSALGLHEPATIEATIPSLRWPRAASPPGVLSLRVKADRLRFLNRSSDKVLDVAGLTVSAESTDLAKELQVKIAGRVGETGSIGVSLALAGLVTNAGNLNLEGLAAGLNAELRDLPVDALDAWLALDGLLPAALGKQMTVTATSTLKETVGPLKARLQADNAHATLECSLRDNVIRLDNPCAIQLEATAELGRKLLSRLHPFLKGISAGTTVKVTVDKEGVMAPLQNFDIHRIVIPRATVDLGKVTLETDVVLQALLSLAKRKSPQRLDAWFTPAVFSIQNGTVQFTNRMDMLFDKDFHVATWGSADLRSAAYRQTVAMTGPTLAKVFHLKNIQPEEMFRIPIRGVASAPQIDYSKAAADLGRLRIEDEALSKLAKQMDRLPPFLRGTVEAQVKKAARQLAGSLGGGDQSPPPPPSARPLPWK